MLVLIWKSKHGRYTVAAKTPAAVLKAYMHLFQLMEEQGYFAGKFNNCEMEDLYEEAKMGDSAAARNFLQWRTAAYYEYEEIEEFYPTVFE